MFADDLRKYDEARQEMLLLHGLHVTAPGCMIVVLEGKARVAMFETVGELRAFRLGLTVGRVNALKQIAKRTRK